MPTMIKYRTTTNAVRLIIYEPSDFNPTRGFYVNSSGSMCRPSDPDAEEFIHPSQIIKEVNT